MLGTLQIIAVTTFRLEFSLFIRDRPLYPASVDVTQPGIVWSCALITINQGALQLPSSHSHILISISKIIAINIRIMWSRQSWFYRDKHSDHNSHGCIVINSMIMWWWQSWFYRDQHNDHNSHGCIEMMINSMIMRWWQSLFSSRSKYYKNIVKNYLISKI